MSAWRHPTVDATTPITDDPSAWSRLCAALIDAADVGYRAVRLRAEAYDPRVESLLDPLARRGIHTQLTLEPRVMLQTLHPAAVVPAAIATWLVEAPSDATTDNMVSAVEDALDHLVRRKLRRGICVELTSKRAHDLESIAAVAVQTRCSLLVVHVDLRSSNDPSDELERSMAYVTARRANQESSALEVEIDLLERDELPRQMAASLSTTAPLARIVPRLVISPLGEVDPLRRGITGFSLGNLDEAPLLQLLARWRTRCAARWIALQRVAIAHVGGHDAWPVIDWPGELIACAGGRVCVQGPRSQHAARGIP